MSKAISVPRLAGGCRCGAVRFEVDQMVHAAICHCGDCRRSSGAPMVGWLGVPAAGFRVTRGEAKRWSSNGEALRHFCGTCGTGLYYINEAVLPGLVDVQMAALDDPAALAPQAQIQVAERLPWVEHLDRLPSFDRFPG